MPDFERSLTVKASADAAFHWLSEPGNMPSYLPMMTKAERTERGLRVTAKGPGGTPTVREVRTVADERARRFEWHPEDSEYHGSMTVEETADGSRVTVRIHATPKADGAQVKQALDFVQGKVQEALGK